MGQVVSQRGGIIKQGPLLIHVSLTVHFIANLFVGKISKC